MLKRFFDILISGIALIILTPLLLVLAILVRLVMGSPILFSQMRPGLKGVPFCILKFRTMRNTVDQYGHQLADAQRLTAFGQFLRSSSLDELPELWNVLKGEMSLVGPRPLLMEYLELYSPEQAQRHNVRPGITGWAQVNGRNTISWDEKFKLDVWYVKNQSFVLDLRILLITIMNVLKKKDISHDSHVTMEKFQGSFKH
jgi:lipopolysaccharide/colanic/teichoic acid biosynthesis glycosyltransferase